MQGAPWWRCQKDQALLSGYRCAPVAPDVQYPAG